MSPRFGLVLAALLIGCTRGAQTPPPAAQASAPPSASEDAGRLAVLIVVDQLPITLLEQMRPSLTGGLARLTGPDAFQAVARYQHSNTFTCPGHATLSTGASPAVHGIINNHWMTEDGTIYCTDEPLLQAEPLADQIAAAGGRVVALSHKDRGSVMLAGDHGTAVYFDNDRDNFIGAEWAEMDLDEVRASVWNPRAPELYATFSEDDRPRENGCDGSTTFPHTMESAEAFLCSAPAGDALVELALTALQAESLGQHSADLLSVSFSNTDYVGHNYGPDSWEALDTFLALDTALGTLFDHLDETLPGRWTAVLSSDHGVAPLGGPKIDPDRVTQVADQALSALSLPTGARFADPDLRLPELPPDRYEEAMQAVSRAVGAIEGITAAYPWRLPEGLSDEAPHADAIREALHPERSGDLYVLLAPEHLYLYKGDERGTSHGTPYDYDQQVPFLMAGTGVIPGKASAEVDVRQVAPTLAHLLGVSPPQHAEQPPVHAGLLETTVAPAIP